MAKNNKKVVILIVEGDSDEALLIERLKELFNNHEIRFEPQRGDILYDLNKRRRPIKEVIGDTVKEVLLKRKFKPANILAVLHIIDTDGCLINEENVIVKDSQTDKTIYEEGCISVCSEGQKVNICSRNSERKNNIQTMSTLKSVVGGKYPYQMYYFSRNLEHVIFNEINPDGNGKVDNVEDFVENLDRPLEQFLSEYMPVNLEEPYELKYINSWNYISEEVNSLKRFTNTPLIIEYIQAIESN